MSHLEIQGIRSIEFDAEHVPSALACSDACSSAEEFCVRNFLPIEAVGHSLLICRWKNAAALGDYLCTYSDADTLRAVCSFLSPKENYWQNIADDSTYCNAATLGWELAAIKIAFERNLQIVSDEYGQNWLILVDVVPERTFHLSPEHRAALDHFCEDQLLAVLEDRYECGGDWQSVFDADHADMWLKNIYIKFCSMHV